MNFKLYLNDMKYKLYLLIFGHAHQVNALALQKLKMAAFSQCTEEITLTAWEEAKQTSPTFFFWDLILHLETLVLLVVRAHRERNFHLHIQVLEELVPLFFALDHVNYARWTPIHIRDMKSLPESINKKFHGEGAWVLSKTGNSYSAIPFDQAHEQENKVVECRWHCWFDRKSYCLQVRAELGLYYLCLKTCTLSTICFDLERKCVCVENVLV